MRRFILLVSLTAAAVVAGSAVAAPPSVQVVIRHQMRGCHAWSVNGDAYTAAQRLRTTPGAILTFTNNDVMPHRLIQVAGPAATLRTAGMNKPGSHASAQLFAKGKYVFKTKPGEDWVKGVMTTGPDNVLRLIVVVK